MEKSDNDLEAAFLEETPTPPKHVTIVNPANVVKIEGRRRGGEQHVFLRDVHHGFLVLPAGGVVLCPATTTTDALIAFDFDDEDGEKRYYVRRASTIDYVTWKRGSREIFIRASGAHVDAVGDFKIDIAERWGKRLASVDEAVAVFRQIEAAFGLEPSPDVVAFPEEEIVSYCDCLRAVFWYEIVMFVLFPLPFSLYMLLYGGRSRDGLWR
jgi:hypothetical protein